jgi:hypothetical protein
VVAVGEREAGRIIYIIVSESAGAGVAGVVMVG